MDLTSELTLGQMPLETVRERTKAACMVIDGVRALVVLLYQGAKLTDVIDPKKPIPLAPERKHVDGEEEGNDEDPRAFVVRFLLGAKNFLLLLLPGALTFEADSDAFKFITLDPELLAAEIADLPTDEEALSDEQRAQFRARRDELGRAQALLEVRIAMDRMTEDVERLVEKWKGEMQEEVRLLKLPRSRN